MEKNTIRRYPKSVLTLYLRMYCKRRDSNNKNKMMEGMKSWLTLSKTEKQQFFNKYRELQMSHKTKLAEYLRKAQPFMKKRKNIHRNLEVHKNTVNYESNIEHHESSKINVTRIASSRDNNCPRRTEDDSQSGDEKNTINDADFATSCINDNQSETCLHSTTHFMEPVLAEPTPPTIRTARELFDMLNTTNELYNETWASMPAVQKSRYRRAVHVLKNEYITKYKAYLESLPSKELYDYYNNFFV